MATQHDLRPSTTEILESSLIEMDTDDALLLLNEENANLRALLDFKNQEVIQLRHANHLHLLELAELTKRFGDVEVQSEDKKSIP